MAQEYGWNVTRPIKSKTFHHGLPESFRIKRVLDLGALALVLCTVAMPVSEAWAADYYVSSPVTTSNGGYTLSIGDTLTITATGSVTTTGPSEYGVQTTAHGTTITHNGPITTTGPDAIGISAGTAQLGITGDVTIRGSGNIATGGPSAYGIYSRVTTGGSAITAGNISTTGPAAVGIISSVTTGNSTITAGNISTAGTNADGIISNVSTGNSTITAGDISTQLGDASGILSYVTTGNSTITVGNISTMISSPFALSLGIYSSVTTGNSAITAGDVSTLGDYAVGINSSVTTGNSTITVGNIATTGFSAYGIYSLVTTGNATITAGNISTTGAFGHGIHSSFVTGNSTITAGNIATQGNYAAAIFYRTLMGDTTITAGDISTKGIDADGIYWIGTGNSTITAGDISTVGANADGIWASMEFSGTTNLSIVNDHTISATGANAMGIKTDSYPASGNHASITNTGTIFSAQSYGIYTTGTGSDTIITNSGMISGYAGAVKFAGTGNTLSLLAGSKVVGLLDIAGTGGNTLSIGKRLNTALAYTYSPTLTVETNGMPYIAYGGVLTVVDPTLFAAEDDMVADLSRSVGNAIDARLGSAIGQSANTIMASTSNAQATGAQWDTWATGLASYREQGEAGLNDGFDTTLGGFTLGSDTVLSSGTRFGGFVGASHAHLTTNAGNEQIDSASTYAGIYAGYTLPNAFVNLGLAGGYANADTIRDVLNNMVAGGIEQAKGNPDGTFLTPQATIGTQIKTSSGILTPSLRVAYTHLAMDSYVETGSLANMTVTARTVSTLDLRGQVAFAIKPIVTATGQIDATMRLGADATFTNSDDISATVLSQPLTFSTTQDTALRGFAGLDLAQKMDNGAKLNLSVEAGYGSNSALTLQGTAGMVWAF